MLRSRPRLGALAVILAAAPLASAQYKITNMGFTADPGERMYMTQSGSVVQDNHMYSNGVLSTLPTFQGVSPLALGINANNLVVGTNPSASNAHAFMYDGSMIDLGNMGGTSADATGVTDSGTIVGGYLTMPNKVTVQKGFEKVGKTVTVLKSLYGGLYDSVSVWGVTESGTAFGDSAGYNNPNINLPVIWKSATPTELPLATGFDEGVVVGANSLGQFIVNETTASYVTDMFLYSGGALTELPNMPGGSGAFAFNSTGEILATGFTSKGAFESVLYKPGVGFINETSLVASAGYTSFQGMAINDAGQIAGVAWGSNGYEGLLLTPQSVPEPTSWCILGVGILALLRRRR